MWIRILHLQLTILEALILKHFLDSNHLSSVHHRRLLKKYACSNGRNPKFFSEASAERHNR